VGSGINVDPKGLVLTCRHVIEAAQLDAGELMGDPPPLPRSKSGWESGTLDLANLVVVFSIEVGEHRVVLLLCRYDFIHGSHQTDHAVIRLRPDEPLPYVSLGNSDDVNEGDRVFTCGFPFGSLLQPSKPVGSLIQQGIISAIRPHRVAERRQSFILDMTIHPGNSGGPLIDEKSCSVVGIVNSVLEMREVPIGLGFAVPVNLVKPFVETARGFSEKDWEQTLRKARRHGQEAKD
jgi:S1-C subfamily serine protease